MSEMLAWSVPVLGRALLHFLWQGAAIGLLAAALLHALRDARPQARYAVACLALLACALAPVLNVIRQLAPGAATGVMPATGLPAPAFAPMLGEATRALATPGRVDDLLSMVVASWAAGACALSLRMALGVWWIQCLCARPCAVSAAWQARLDALALRFGLRRQVTLRVVGTLDSPASVGWWRPVVLLPTALLARLPVELVEALVAHELAHIRRHDYLVNLLQGVVEALLFYHPVTWWLSRRIRRERELVADQLAADVTGAPRTLARALTELSEHAGCAAPACSLPSPALAAHGGQLMSRIEQLVRPRASGNGGRVAFPLLGLAAACIVMLAHAQAGGSASSSAAQAEAGDVQHVRLAENARGTDFALVRKGREGITMSGDVRYAELVDAMRDDMRGDFLWFRRNGRGYVIEDAGIIERVGRVWVPTEEFGRRMEALSSRMDAHGRKMEALGARLQAQSAQRQGDPKMEAAARRMETLGKQQQRLAEQRARLAAKLASADEAGRERLEREMNELDLQQDALDERMDAQSQLLETASARQEEHSASMEAISLQMEEAGKPMEALGEQMDALGEEMDALSARAERETLALIDEAVAKGLAKPAPARK